MVGRKPGQTELHVSSAALILREAPPPRRPPSQPRLQLGLLCVGGIRHRGTHVDLAARSVARFVLRQELEQVKAATTHTGRSDGRRARVVVMKIGSCDGAPGAPPSRRYPDGDAAIWPPQRAAWSFSCGGWLPAARACDVDQRLGVAALPRDEHDLAVCVGLAQQRHDARDGCSRNVVESGGDP